MKRNPALIFLGGILIWISMYVYVPILPSYASSVGANYQDIGIIGGVYGILPIFLCVVLGYVSEKYGRDRLFLIMGFAVVTVSGILFWATDTVPWVIVARGVAAAGCSWWVIIAAAYARYKPADQQVKAQGVINAGSNVGKAIGCVLCMILAEIYGNRCTFIIATLAGLAGLALMLCLKKAPPPDPRVAESVSMKSTFQLLKNRDLMIFSILAIIVQMVIYAVPTTFTPVAVQKIVNENEMVLGLVQLIFVVVTALGAFVVGTPLYKRLGGIKMLSVAFLLSAVACIPMFYESMAGIYAMQAVIGVSYGISFAVLSGFVVDAVRPDQRSGALGVFQTIYSIGIFLGPTLTGSLTQHISFDASYWLFAILSAVAAVMCLLLIPKKYAAMT